MNTPVEIAIAAIAAITVIIPLAFIGWAVYEVVEGFPTLKTLASVFAG